MGCGCGKKKAKPIARRGFTASTEMNDDLKAQIPGVRRPATWQGKPKGTQT